MKDFWIGNKAGFGHRKIPWIRACNCTPR